MHSKCIFNITFVDAVMGINDSLQICAKERWPALLRKIEEYIPDPNTMNVIVEPIKTSICANYGEFYQLIMTGGYPAAVQQKLTRPENFFEQSNGRR